jgi:predicted alpha/beta hydrolase
VAPGFNREAQALAAMGFAVLHVNYRGSAGAGLRQREDLRQSFDRTPLDDVLATLAWLQGRHPFDARRVAIGGEGFGGYLALRALQLHPAAFRCGVSINAVAELEQYRDAADRQYARERGPHATPLNMHAMQAGTATLKVPFDFNREMLRRFYGESGASLAPFSVARQWAALKRPILFLHDPGNELAEADRIRSLQRQLERAGRQAVYAEISSRFARGEPGERAAVIRKIGEFLNTTLYDFDVKVGELTEQDGPR